MYVTKFPLLMVCSGTVFRTKGRSVKAAAITDDATPAHAAARDARARRRAQGGQRCAYI